MNRKLARSLFSLTVAGALLGATGAVALADALPQAPLMDEVFALQHTPHLFFLDEQGAVHLASDPKALTGIDVDWFARRTSPWTSCASTSRASPSCPWPWSRSGTPSTCPRPPSAAGPPSCARSSPSPTCPRWGSGARTTAGWCWSRRAWEARYGLRTSDLQTEDFSLDGVPAVGPAMPQEPTPNEVASA